ncbi:hypothetical protein SAMN05920897_12031 [Alkalispirochaeta americana]|uniref:Uncharacterized protein n=1 Tax=Alkalispirochaeta americana TaxID=159291 RepID=A0A1N6X5F2_9SPIO|nr:hypothetical protein [Alkalispirochaeta americana]SIQ97461.1 hypothetical protein SAMN05920897_12031 [Alkalispirochaeta americana]
MAALLYVAGNYQAFSQETQTYLLRLIQYLGAFSGLTALLAFAGELVLVVSRREWRRLYRLAGLVLTVFLVGALFLGSSAIIVLQKPL